MPEPVIANESSNEARLAKGGQSHPAITKRSINVQLLITNYK